MSQNNIGEFIQQSRKARGFTQKDLGDRIGVSDKTISKWENGNSIPDTSILNEQIGRASCRERVSSPV